MGNAQLPGTGPPLRIAILSHRSGSKVRRQGIHGDYLCSAPADTGDDALTGNAVRNRSTPRRTEIKRGDLDDT